MNTIRPFPKLPTVEKDVRDTYEIFDRLRSCGQKLMNETMIALNYKPNLLIKPHLKTLDIKPCWPERLKTKDIGMERLSEISSMLYAYINVMKEYEALLDERIPNKRKRPRHHELAMEILADMDHFDLPRCVGALEKWY